ncbi:MAG: hypothetical protein Q7T62_14885 [Undibacterium sp.]|nr:hypothetical protein [Undibacterium sp.]
MARWIRFIVFFPMVEQKLDGTEACCITVRKKFHRQLSVNRGVKIAIKIMVRPFLLARKFLYEVSAIRGYFGAGK